MVSGGPAFAGGKAVFPMNGPRLTISQLADFLFRRDGGGVLPALCREEEAEYVTAEGAFLRFAPCDPETQARVRAQAQGWRLCSLWRESWDPAVGREDRGGSGECAVPEQFYLAEDGNFAGAVAYEEDGDAYLLRSACLRDYRGVPLPLRGSARFGSSDRDRMDTCREFLVKAE